MNRLGVFIIALFLLIPSGVSAEWLMFGNGAERNFVADITERTIQKRTPVPSWDRGSSSEEVYSWGTAIGNFTPNITGSFRRLFLLSRTIRCRLSPSALVKLSHEWKTEVTWSHCYASSMFQFPDVPRVERLRAARDHLFAANLQHACI